MSAAFFVPARARSAILELYIDIARALVEALVGKGSLVTEEIDAFISATVTTRASKRNGCVELNGNGAKHPLRNLRRDL